MNKKHWCGCITNKNNNNDFVVFKHYCDLHKKNGINEDKKIWLLINHSQN